jgi:hypothetical protein
MTANNVSQQEVILSVGDTTYLDYGKILAKQDGYGPQGKGGNGLLLHSAMAVEPEQGQPLGLLWQKMWNRDNRVKPPVDETPEQKKERQAKTRKEICTELSHRCQSKKYSLLFKFKSSKLNLFSDPKR